VRFLAAAALCALGVISATLVAGYGGSAAAALSDTSVTESVPTEAEAAPTVTDSPTVTESQTETQIVTQTVEQTPTVEAPVATAETGSDTDTWVLVLIGIAVVVFVVLIVMFARRGHAGGVAVDRRQRMRAAVSSWTAQGWAIERQTADSTWLARNGERLLVSVDAAGDVTSDRLAP
jgi:hypothetical protein